MRLALSTLLDGVPGAVIQSNGATRASRCGRFAIGYLRSCAVKIGWTKSRAVSVGIAACGGELGPSRRSVCAPCVLEGGVRLRVGDSGAVLRSGQRPELYVEDT